MMNIRFAVVIAGLLLACLPATAHPGHDHSPGLRVWKDANGLFEIEASFVLARDGQVRLCKHDGELVRVPLESLSASDRQWVGRRMGELGQINIAAEKETVIAAPPVSVVSGPGPVVATVMTLGVLAFFVFIGVLLRRRTNLSPLATHVVTMLGTLSAITAMAQTEKKIPVQQKHFEPFKAKLELRSDSEFLYVGSDAFPDHPMMKGITAWQRQVPLPQPYTGRNAWRIPLNPKLAAKPISAKTALFRGAIALAVNGVPIFNALNNRGDDAYLAGELDEYGGHCGRGDDYHYHIAPVHLEKTVGKGNPIAYALDGYPLYGYTDASGREPNDLDEFNGRMEKDGYRYYATRKYPYINGGLRGEVTVRGDQVDPQPKDAPVRPAGEPLRGAKITDFVRDDEKKSYTVRYELRGQKLSWNYTINKDGTYKFVYTDAAGEKTTETLRRREGKGGGQPPKKDGPPPKKGGPKKDDPKRDDPKRDDHLPESRPAKESAFKLTSSAFASGGKIPVEFTGDGDGISPPLAWKGAPAGTKFYALQLWHKPFADGDEVKSYWVISHIPASVTQLPKNVKNVGKAGLNDKDRADYDPMKSKGPGVKEYHITIYALSAEPKFRRGSFYRADLLEAIREITLAESTLTFQYERKTK